MASKKKIRKQPVVTEQEVPVIEENPETEVDDLESRIATDKEVDEMIDNILFKYKIKK